MKLYLFTVDGYIDDELGFEYIPLEAPSDELAEEFCGYIECSIDMERNTRSFKLVTLKELIDQGFDREEIYNFDEFEDYKEDYNALP